MNDYFALSDRGYKVCKVYGVPLRYEAWKPHQGGHVQIARVATWHEARDACEDHDRVNQLSQRGGT